MACPYMIIASYMQALILYFLFLLSPSFQALSKSNYPNLPYHNNQHAGTNYNTSHMNGYPSNNNNPASGKNGRAASYHQDSRHMYNIPPQGTASAYSYNSHRGGWMEGERTEYNVDYYHQQRGGDRQMVAAGTGGGGGKAQRNEKTTEL